MFAWGIKTQTPVRVWGVKTSHRQFPNFEKQGSENTDVAESQRSENHIQIHVIYREGSTLTPEVGADGDT